MKDLLRCVHSDILKLKHTQIIWIHLLIPILGVFTFVSYLFLYRNNASDATKVGLIVELVTAVYPIIIGVVVGMVMQQEEKAGHFMQMMGSYITRPYVLFSKLVTLLVLGICSISILFGGISLSCQMFGLLATMSSAVFLKAAGAMLAGNIATYLLHVFISLKSGIGGSIFVGVVECMMVVMFSNVTMESIWEYIPFAWSIKLVQYSVQGSQSGIMVNALSWLKLAVIFILLLLGVFVWFSRWEGRKYYE